MIWTFVIKSSWSLHGVQCSIQGKGQGWDSVPSCLGIGNLREKNDTQVKTLTSHNFCMREAITIKHPSGSSVNSAICKNFSTLCLSFYKDGLWEIFANICDAMRRQEGAFLKDRATWQSLHWGDQMASMKSLNLPSNREASDGAWALAQPRSD